MDDPGHIVYPKKLGCRLLGLFLFCLALCFLLGPLSLLWAEPDDRVWKGIVLPPFQ